MNELSTIFKTPFCRGINALLIALCNVNARATIENHFDDVNYNDCHPLTLSIWAWLFHDSAANRVCSTRLSKLFPSIFCLSPKLTQNARANNQAHITVSQSVSQFARLSDCQIVRLSVPPPSVWANCCRSVKINKHSVEQCQYPFDMVRPD